VLTGGAPVAEATRSLWEEHQCRAVNPPGKVGWSGPHLGGVALARWRRRASAAAFLILAVAPVVLVSGRGFLQQGEVKGEVRCMGKRRKRHSRFSGSDDGQEGKGRRGSVTQAFAKRKGAERECHASFCEKKRGVREGGVDGDRPLLNFLGERGFGGGSNPWTAPRGGYPLSVGVDGRRSGALRGQRSDRGGWGTGTWAPTAQCRAVGSNRV
jgi:hypothetical protein